VVEASLPCPEGLFNGVEAVEDVHSSSLVVLCEKIGVSVNSDCFAWIATAYLRISRWRRRNQL
jgi:hypothetical protein